jgi:conjugative transfer region lipoprotein (TIGR03751 family)
MHRNWIDTLCVCLLVTALSGCATSKEKLLTHGSNTMLDIWNRNTSSQPLNAPATRQLLDAREALRRPPMQADEQPVTVNAEYTRTARNEIDRQFHRLPNPDLVMYVFPHLAGSDPVPVPGYSTVFPLHLRVHYALPGERTEDY